MDDQTARCEFLEEKPATILAGFFTGIDWTKSCIYPSNGNLTVQA